MKWWRWRDLQATRDARKEPASRRLSRTASRGISELSACVVALMKPIFAVDIRSPKAAAFMPKRGRRTCRARFDAGREPGFHALLRQVPHNQTPVFQAVPRDRTNCGKAAQCVGTSPHSPCWRSIECPRGPQRSAVNVCVGDFIPRGRLALRGGAAVLTCCPVW